MQRFAAVVACVFMVCLSPTLRAQSPAPPVTQHAFSYCSVIDTAGHKVWASPVFEYEYVPANAGQFSRTQDMATEFHTFVGSMGGAGDKACQSANGRPELEALRNESRAILTKRFMGMVRAHNWMDMPWTPKPWNPATAAAKPAAVAKYFYCVATDADLRKTVAALVFEMSVDESNPIAAYTQAEAYGKEFTRDVAAAHGLAQAYPQCYFKDTRAEAEKALHDYRKMFSGFNLRFTDVTWRPTQASAATPPATTAPAAPAALATESSAIPAQGKLGIKIGEVSPTLALALGMGRARGALVVEALKGSPAEAAGIKPMDVVLSINQQAVNQFADLTAITSRLPAGTPVTLQLWRERAEHEVRVGLAGQPAAVTAQTGTAIAPSTETPAASTAAPAAGASKYCHVFMQFVSKPGGVHSKVWENRDSDGSEAAMTATLTAFTAHMYQQQPKVWHEFTGRPPRCDMNLGYCYNMVVRRFGGTSQIAGQFCKRTREEAEADWARLTQNSSGMEIVAWPEES